MNGSDLPRAMPQPWWSKAACKADNVDPEWFFPEDTNKTRGRANVIDGLRTAKAQTICAACTVGDDCESEGHRLGDNVSIRNGKTPSDRRPASQPRLDHGHGTDAGYRAHYRNGTTPCGECRVAHSEAQGARRR